MRLRLGLSLRLSPSQGSPTSQHACVFTAPCSVTKPLRPLSRPRPPNNWCASLGLGLVEKEAQKGVGAHHAIIRGLLHCMVAPPHLNGGSHQHAMQDLTSSDTLHHPAPRQAIGDWIHPARFDLTNKRPSKTPPSHSTSCRCARSTHILSPLAGRCLQVHDQCALRCPMLTIGKHTLSWGYGQKQQLAPTRRPHAQNEAIIHHHTFSAFWL